MSFFSLRNKNANLAGRRSSDCCCSEAFEAEEMFLRAGAGTGVGSDSFNETTSESWEESSVTVEVVIRAEAAKTGAGTGAGREPEWGGIASAEP